MLKFLKKENIKEKINNLNIILSMLDNKEIKYNVIYNISDDITITISDKTTQRVTKSEIKESKKTKKESE